MLRYRDDTVPTMAQAVELYAALRWSSAHKPEALLGALRGSHALVTAWHGERLVGLGNAISDGHLVVYFPHLLVHPDFQRRGIGATLLEMLMERYVGFHQQMLVADSHAVGFYERMGFARAASTQSMWIYAGDDHD